MDATENQQESIRTFFAIDIANHLKHAIELIIEQLKPHFNHIPIRWMAPEKLHITLHFVGQTDRQILPKLCAQVADLMQTCAPFELSWAKHLMTFPSGQKPHIIALKPEPDEAIRTIAAKIDQVVMNLGFLPEKREFRPHLTLARMQGQLETTVLKDYSCQLPTIPINEVVLFQSKAGHPDEAYKTLCCFPLL